MVRIRLEIQNTIFGNRLLHCATLKLSEISASLMVIWIATRYCAIPNFWRILDYKAEIIALQDVTWLGKGKLRVADINYDHQLATNIETLKNSVTARNSETCIIEKLETILTDLDIENILKLCADVITSVATKCIGLSEKRVKFGWYEK